MTIKEIVKRILMPDTYSMEAYRNYLRRNGVLIGDHTVVYSPNHTNIDIRKPWLISIGDYCEITKGVTILAHDYSISVPRKMYGEFRGGSLPVTIGDNVFIGSKSTILMGTKIGSNSIVGASSVVKGDFSQGGVVIAGNPAKVVCSVSDYYNKLGNKWVASAKECAKAIYRNSGKLPTVEEMSDGFAWLYLPRTSETISKYPDWFILSADDPEAIQNDFMASVPVYSSFQEFLDDIDFEHQQQ